LRAGLRVDLTSARMEATMPTSMIARRLTVFRVCTVAAALVVSLPTLRAQEPPDGGAPTPVEQALIEYGCTAKRAVGASEGEYEAYQRAELVRLRTDFGRDLGRLSRTERRSIDTVCSKVQAAEGRDAYVSCLNGQLVTLKSRRKAAAPAAVDPAAVTP